MEESGKIWKIVVSPAQNHEIAGQIKHFMGEKKNLFYLSDLLE
jgi:hypothetical protein